MTHEVITLIGLVVLVTKGMKSLEISPSKRVLLCQDTIYLCHVHAQDME